MTMSRASLPKMLTSGATGHIKWCHGVSLYIPQSTINATVQEDILLSVDYSCHGVPTIEWKYISNWGKRKIVEWKPGTQVNISESHKDRVCTFDNGSIQLFSVGVRDSGYYVITVTEHLGSSQSGSIVLHVSEIRYEDLHFVAVFIALLAALAAVLISLMWVCNRCAYKFQRKRRHKLKDLSLSPTLHDLGLQICLCHQHFMTPVKPFLSPTWVEEHLAITYLTVTNALIFAISHVEGKE
ncbi:hypothetical protein H920_09361 [Fukomys damarensis]|uniref:V-set and transmembrane domain-containing protein 5 n=1 Tax=Fukomys damarensis TaxID=885580 RepID=A0A091DFI3_FUKDA|nr:hypothetical protein H920_09361 [Fukomys damarensis]